MFQAGVAVRDITPEPGIPMWGYSNRPGPATGTLDPLYAKAIAFRAGGKTVAMVSLDLGRVPLAHVCERIRDRAKKVGVDYVFFAATHTHHGPVMEAKGAPYLATMESQIGECVEAAASSLEPARIGVGRAQADIAHNRRKLLQDGRCFMLWRNEQRTPTEPVDREAGIVKIVKADGSPLAVLINLACHPVVMGPSNCQYSADYVGEMTRILKEKIGAECLFFQGACGNINPYLDKTPMDEGAVDAMRAVGRACADILLPEIAQIPTAAPAEASIDYLEKKVVVGVRWDLQDAATVQALQAVHGPMFDVYIEGAGPDLAVPLSVVVINKALAFAGLPGEIFVQYQLALKSGSPLRDTFLCGYANGYYAYFPTVRDAAAGGYGGTMASYAGLGAGDKLVTEAEIEIGKMIGKLKPTARLEDFAMLEDGPIPE
jgi:hypothetical protein